MVNLVIVSHSHQVAAGVKALADQMANHAVKIVAVGGIQDHTGEWLLGTDAVRVAAAIEKLLDHAAADIRKGRKFWVNLAAGRADARKVSR